MKKVITNFILLCIICTPEPTFSQNSLKDLINQFIDTGKQLNYLSQDLMKINLATSNQSEQYFLRTIADDITSSLNIINHTVDLIFLFPAIKDDEHKPFYGRYVKIQLSRSKKKIESDMESIQIGYLGIKNRAALHLIDKAKDRLRASLSLFDRSIEVLQLNEIKKSN